MKIALHVVHALMSAPLKQFLRVKSTRLTRMYAPIVAPAPMYARLKQFTLNSRFEMALQEHKKNPVRFGRVFLLVE